MRIVLAFLLLSATLGCAKSEPSATTTTTNRECARTIDTGVVGASTQQSDTDHSVSPNAEVPILVFRADEPGLAAPIPPELEKLAEHARADAKVGPPGKPSTQRVAPPPEQLGPPVASTATNADGCFELELPAGDYVLGQPQSVSYVGFTVAQGKRTACGHETGYRFSIWRCDAAAK